MNATKEYMSEKEACLFVSALVHIAGIDGMKDGEEKLINEFIDDLGFADRRSYLLAYPFSLEEAVTVIQTPHARSALIKSCVMMIIQDHEVSAEEREALEFFRRAFLPQETLDALLESVIPGDLE